MFRQFFKLEASVIVFCHHGCSEVHNDSWADTLQHLWRQMCGVEPVHDINNFNSMLGWSGTCVTHYYTLHVLALSELISTLRKTSSNFDVVPVTLFQTKQLISSTHWTKHTLQVDSSFKWTNAFTPPVNCSQTDGLSGHTLDSTTPTDGLSRHNNLDRTTPTDSLSGHNNLDRTTATDSLSGHNHLDRTTPNRWLFWTLYVWQDLFPPMTMIIVALN